MEYSFSCIEYDLKNEKVLDDAFALGFKRKGTWWMVENLDKDSGMFDEELENSLHLIRKHLKTIKPTCLASPRKLVFTDI